MALASNNRQQADSLHYAVLCYSLRSNINTKPPTAGAIFPKEIYITPRSWAEAHYNIVRWTTMPRGGHFAAMEEGELLLTDVREFYRTLR